MPRDVVIVGGGSLIYHQCLDQRATRSFLMMNGPSPSRRPSESPTRLR